MGALDGRKRNDRPGVCKGGTPLIGLCILSAETESMPPEAPGLPPQAKKRRRERYAVRPIPHQTEAQRQRVRFGKDEQGSGRNGAPPKTQRQRFWVGKEEQGSAGRATSGSPNRSGLCDDAGGNGGKRTLRGRPSGTYFLVRQKVCKDRSKGFPLCKPPHGRFVSGRRAAPCQCGLSPLFSKKWLYGRGTTHDPDRLKLPAVALVQRLLVRSAGSFATLTKVYITTAEAMERNV